MTTITIRNLPEETRRALKVRVAWHGRSTEAEIRLILQAAVQPARGLGSARRDIGRDLGGVSSSISRDHTPPKPAQFG